MKFKHGLISLTLAALAVGSAQAACDVTLSAVLPGAQAVLKANCGVGVTVKTITWKRDNPAVTLAGPLTLDPNVVGTDIYYTTPLLDGAHVYTAEGTDAADALIVAGTQATITTSQPALTVAPTEGGTVASAPTGINACMNASGTCTASFATGTVVSLTATPDGSHSFSGWSGDCTGTATVCAVSMSGPKTVSANFGPVPVSGGCGGDSNTTPVSSAPVDPGLCATGTPTAVADPAAAPYNYTWGCNGANGGTSTSATACSAPKIVVGLCGTANGGTGATTAPTGTAACNPGAIINMTAGASTYTWNCQGFNTGATSAQCSVAMAPTDGACGSANGGNTLAAPTGTAACTAGNITGMNTPAAGGDYTWTCSGLAGGNPSGTCTAHQTVNGACGTANGVAVGSAPTTNLCVAGNNPTAVAGTGPWTWGCNGVNGGTSTTATACSAPVLTGGCPATPANYAVLDYPNYNSSSAYYTTTIAAGQGLALRFTINRSTYLNGYKVTDGVGGTKSYKISRCPGGTDGPVDGQNGTTSVNGDGATDDCSTMLTDYVRYKDTSGASPVYYANASNLSWQATCFLPTTTAQGSSTPATYYLNIENTSTTSQTGIQLKNIAQPN